MLHVDFYHFDKRPYIFPIFGVDAVHVQGFDGRRLRDFVPIFFFDGDKQGQTILCHELGIR